MARILIVDADTASLELTAAVLRIENHRVSTAANAADAFQIIRTGEFVPHILIVDPELKRISGLQLAANLRLKMPHLAILFISDNAGISEVLQGSVGIDSVIQKPFSASELRSAVRRRLKGRDREKLVA